MSHVKISYLSLEDDEESTTIVVQPSYNKEFYEELKVLVPEHAREWDQDTRAWHIDEEYIEEVRDLCQKYFTDVEDET